jgi:hypothetical protein
MRRPSPTSLLRGALLFAAGALVSGAIALAATTNGTKDVWQTGRSGGTPIFGTLNDGATVLAASKPFKLR